MSTITSISTEGPGVKNCYVVFRSSNKCFFLSTGKRGQMNSAKGKKNSATCYFSKLTKT